MFLNDVCSSVSKMKTLYLEPVYVSEADWRGVPVTARAKVGGRAVELPFGQVVEASFVVPSVATNTETPATTRAPATAEATTETRRTTTETRAAGLGGGSVFGACAASFAAGAGWAAVVIWTWSRKGGKARAQKAVEAAAKCFAEM